MYSVPQIRFLSPLAISSRRIVGPLRGPDNIVRRNPRFPSVTWGFSRAPPAEASVDSPRLSILRHYCVERSIASNPVSFQDL